jgi:hypothetical protein
VRWYRRGDDANRGLRRQEVAVTQDYVFDAIVATKPGPDEILFVGRVGKEYAWRIVAPGEPMIGEIDGAFPDAWMFSTIAWPIGADLDVQRAFFDDLVAEVETMANGPDRCRWEFDDPYGYRH